MINRLVSIFVFFILISSFAFASFGVFNTSEPYFQPIVKTYEQDANGDGTPDVISEFTINNDGTVEVYVRDLIEQGKGKTQKWFGAVCGDSDIGVSKDEKGNDGSWVSTGALNYAYLPNYGLPSDWCPNHGNYGYVLSGAGNGDKEYRLHVSNPKDFEVFVGTGTQETALIYETDKTVVYETEAGTTFESEIYVNSQRVNFDLWVEDGVVKKYGANASAYLPEFTLGNGSIITTINKPVAEDSKGFYVQEGKNKIRLDFSDVCGIKQFRTHETNTYTTNLGETYQSYYSNETYDSNCSYTLYEEYYTEWDASVQENRQVFNKTVINYTFVTDWFIDPRYSIESTSANIYNQTRYESNTNVHLEVNDSNLVAYWSFDADSSTIYDVTNNDNDGSLVNNANIDTSCTSGYGACVEVTPPTAYVQIPDDASIQDLPLDGFTVSAWINLDSAGDASAGRIVDKRDIDAIGGWTMASSGTSASATRLQFIASFSSAVYQEISNGYHLNFGEWYMVTVVFNSSSSSNRAEMYIDGQSVASSTTLSPSGTYKSDVGQQLGIGGTASGVRDSDGHIDEVMLFDGMLNATQIEEIYNNQSQRFYSNGNITFKSQNITIDTQSEVNITFAGQNNVSTNFTARIDYWDVSNGYDVSSSNLVGFWSGNGDGTDLSSQGNDATLSGATATTIKGLFNESFNITSGGNYMNVSTNGFSATGGAFGGWFKHEGAPQQNFFSMRTAFNDELRFSYTTGDRIYMEVGTNGGELSYYVQNYFPDGEWHHFVFTWGGNRELYMYIDGVNQTLLASADYGSNIFYTVKPTAYIGRYDLSDSSYWNGSMDDIFMYDRLLTEEEILYLYNRNLANWTTGNELEVTKINSTHYASEGQIIPSTTTNLLPILTLVSDSNNFYTSYFEADAYLEVNDYLPPSFVTLNFTITKPYDTEILSGIGVQVNISTNKPNSAVNYTYDLYRDFYGFDAINQTYVPNQTINISNTGDFVLYVYGIDNLSFTHNDSVNFTFVKVQEETEDLKMLAIILGIFAFAGLMFYASNSVRPQELVSGRVWEKVLLYFTGASFALIGLFAILAYVSNTAEYAYLVTPLTTFFVVAVLAVFALVCIYAVNLIEQIIQQKQEKENEKY